MANPLIRCMGGKFCNHGPGECTAMQGVQAFGSEAEPPSSATPAKEINGWTPPLFYSMANDETRVATQADFDRLAAIERAYVDTLALARKIIERHENLLLNERRRADQA